MRRRRIAGILPVRSLELLGTGSVGSDYLDVIVRRGHERAVRAALAQRFTTDGVMLDLAQLHRDASVAGDLARDLDAHGWVRASWKRRSNSRLTRRRSSMLRSLKATSRLSGFR